VILRAATDVDGSMTRSSRTSLAGVAAALSILAAPAVAQTVIDGNAIRLGATTFRLWGADAPDLRQTCDAGWLAGRAAAEALAGLIRGRPVACEPKAQDRAGRTLAICRAVGEDLGAAMVGLGMAWADVQVSRDYAALETQARSARLGVHGHACQTAWEWRKSTAKPFRDESQ
jgi:endonuclease YncB( thermonuclease family)